MRQFRKDVMSQYGWCFLYGPTLGWVTNILGVSLVSGCSEGKKGKVNVHIWSLKCFYWKPQWKELEEAP